MKELSHEEALGHVEHEATTPEQIHQVVTAHPHAEIHDAAARHANTPGKTLQHMYNHPQLHDDVADHEEMKNTIAAHPNAPRQVVKDRLDNIQPADYQHSEHGPILMHSTIDPKERAAKVKQIFDHKAKSEDIDSEDESLKRGVRPLSYDQKSLIHEFLHHPETDPKTVSNFVKHPHPEVASYAAASPHATEEDHAEYFKRKDIKPKHINQAVNDHYGDADKEAHPSFLHHAYQHLKTAPKASANDRWDRNNPEMVKEKIVQHKNAPLSVLEDAIGKKAVKKESGSWKTDLREKAFAHPSMPSETVRDWVQKGDIHAMRAAVTRPGTDEQTLRTIDSHGHEDLNHQMLSHPNYPKDLTLKRIHDSTDNARKVMKRKELDPEVLSELINHKNQKVAVEALDHGSINKEHVLQAYKRKAKEVSQAAAAHELAPDEVKMEKAKTSPEAAVKIANNTDDPELLAKLHSLHGTDRDVMKAIAKNKSTGPEIINKLIDQQMNEPHRDQRGSSLHHELSLYDHPNLDKEGRAKFLKNNPIAVSDHTSLTGDEISGALEDWSNRSGRESRHSLESFAHNVFNHPNLKPEDAKDIVTGKYGKHDRSTYNLHAINDNPHVFTPDVVKAGLNTNPELTTPELVKQLAQSKHLSSEDLESYIRKPIPNNDEGHSHHIARSTGALQNPNLKPEVLKDVLSGADSNLSTPSNIGAALDNPNITKEHVVDAAKNPNLRLDFDTAKGLKDHLEKHGLAHAMLKETVHPELAEQLISHYGSKPESDRVISGVQNKNPDVVKAIIDQYASAHTPSRDSRGRVVRPKVDPEVHPYFDKLADSGDKDVVTKAFQFMSPEKQHEVINKIGADDPHVIKAMSDDSVRNFKISPDMPVESTRALLEHHAATPEHFKQAIDHSEEAAVHAIHSMENPDKNERKGSFEPRFEHENMEDIYSHAAIKYPDSTRITSQVAKNTRDPKLLRSMMVNPETPWSAQNEISDNPQTKPADVESLITSLHGPEHEDLMRTYALSNKSTVPTLQHIVDHYPNVMPDVALNPRAASAKVLKTLISKGDTPTKVNLVDNPKVPEGIKDELLKDKHVLIHAKPDSVPEEELEKLAKDKDLSLARAALNHKHATASVAEKAVDHALKNIQNDPEAANKLLESASRKEFLEPDTQKKLLLHSPITATNVMQYSTRGGPFNKEAAIDALNKFQGQEGYDEMLGTLANKGGLKDPVITDKIVDTMPLDSDGGTRYLNRLFNSNSPTVKPEHYERALSRMKEARPANFKYSKDDAGEEQRKSDAELMNTLIGDAPDKALTEYVKSPAFASIIAQNPKAGRENFGTALNHIINDGQDLEDGEWKNIIDHSNITHSQLNQVFDHLAKDPMNNSGSLEHLAKARHISPDLASKMYKQLPREAGVMGDLAQNPALPEEDLKDYVSKGPDELVHASQNPKFRLSMSNPEHLSEPSKKFDVYDNVARNQYASPEDLERIHADINDVKAKGEIYKGLVSNVRTPEHLAQRLLDEGKVTKDDMYRNPALGGKLWREQKHEFPRVRGLQEGKEINEAVFRPREEKIKKVMSMIPKGESLDWTQFKKENPSLAGDPIVQKMFTSAPKTRVDKAHAEKYLEDMPAKKFHVSYSRWTGMQRHNDEPQAVFLLNNGESMDGQYKADPNMTGLYRSVQLASQNEGHPHGPQAIGWSRVDTSDPNHWFIDEIQSDFNSQLSRELDEINKTGKTRGLERFGLDPSNGNRSVNNMVDMINGWEKALLSNIVETARKHGVNKVSIHSGQSKTFTNKGKQAEVTNKYDKLYNRLTQDMGFKPAKYEDIPSHDPHNEIVGQPVWTLDLNEPQEAQEPPQASEKQNAPEAKRSAQERVK